MKFLPGASICLVFVNGVFASSNDANNALAMVNQARQAKGVQPLLWDASLVTYAQYWADEMASGRRPFEHAQGANRPSQGENLYEQSAGQCDAAYDNPLQTGMHAWLSQEHLYTGQPIMTGHEPWLHWAQCMWSATTNIGCARAYAISEPYKFFRRLSIFTRRKYRRTEAVLMQITTPATLGGSIGRTPRFQTKTETSCS